MKKFLAVILTVCSIMGSLTNGVSAYAMATKNTGVKNEAGIEIKVPVAYKSMSNGVFETPSGAISVTVDRIATLNGDKLDADCVKQILNTYGDSFTLTEINQVGNAFYTAGTMPYDNIGNIIVLTKFWNIGSEVYREQIVGGNARGCAKVYNDVEEATKGKYKAVTEVNGCPTEADLVKRAKEKSIQFFESPLTFKIKVIKVKGNYIKGSKGYWYLRTDGIHPKKGSQVYLTTQAITWGTSAKARKTSGGFIAQGRVDPINK